MRGSLGFGIDINLIGGRGGVAVEVVTSIATDDNIVITFSEAVQPATVTNVGDGTGSFELYNDTQAAWVNGALSTSDNIQWTFDPTANFTIGDELTLYLKSTILTVVGSNPYAGPFEFKYIVVNSAPSAPIIGLISVSSANVAVKIETSSTDVEDGTINLYDVFVDGVLFDTNQTILQGGSYLATGLTNDIPVSITFKGKDSEGLLSVGSNSIDVTPTTATLALVGSLAKEGGTPGVNAPSTTTWDDIVGVGNATLTGFTYTASDGWNNNPNQLVFNDSYGNIPHSAVTAPDKITIETWFRPTALVTDMTEAFPSIIMKYRAFAFLAGYGLFFQQSTERIFWRVAVGGAWLDVTADVSGWDTSTFRLLHGSFDGRYAKLYSDNVEIGSVDAGVGDQNIVQDPNTGLVLGKIFDGGAYQNPGQISLSTVKLYPRAITEPERAAALAGGVGT